MCEELKFYLNREYNRLLIVFDKIKFKDKDIESFVKAYWDDCRYFYVNQDDIKAFELVNYVWGILDTLAILKIIEVPEDVKKWFKIDQDS